MSRYQFGGGPADVLVATNSGTDTILRFVPGAVVCAARAAVAARAGEPRGLR